MINPKASMRIVLLSLLLPGWAMAQEAPRTAFLGVEEARVAIVDESVEPYFSLLGALEMGVKTGLPITGETSEERLAEVKRRYQAGVLEFTPEERAAIGWIVEQLDKPLREHYPKFAAQPWRFIKVAPNIEGGLPHTRGDQIVLSANDVESIRAKHARDPESALTRFGPIFIHEQMHVVQRLHPDWFLPLYTSVWGFEKTSEIVLPESITQRVVVNPDGVDLGWVFPIREGEKVRRVTPRIVFAEGVAQPRMDRDFQMIVVDLDTQESRPLNADPGYLKELQRIPIQSTYHPNEIAADVFAHLFTVEHLMNRGEDWNRANVAIGQHWGPTREWFVENFK